MVRTRSSNHPCWATAALALGTLLAPQAGVLQSLEPLGDDPHVIIIIVDGLRPDLITAERTPVLRRLVDEGASTLEAKTVRPSVTLPSITSMMTGLRPQDHGITWNDYSPDKGSVAATTIFDVE
jgi:predicted AlkP superfamily pyrophosphatase or phosphodiesterase